MNKAIFSAAILAATGFGHAAVAQDCNWVPERPVNVIVPWGAGGTTDANARQLATALQERFGVPFNVVNRTGGNGVTGHTAISRARPDGYTIGAATVEIDTMHWFGLTDLTYEDITPIALMNMPAAGVIVNADSPFDSLTELLDYARENPGELTASGTALGGIWHLALAGMLEAEGMDPQAIRWVPSQGSASALQELLAHGVDMVTPSLEEGKSLIDSGEVRALAYMSDTPSQAFPDVPLTADELESGWTLAAFTSISGPKDLPENITCSYEAALEEIVASDRWAEFRASLGAPVVWGDAAQLRSVMEAYDESLGATIEAIGMKKND
ncbi:tripartite tricarboxylate transporter substrate binding protein [Martelella sp. AD-3]|uniref:Bug family tripartite tricarboxylate transporter substrate binding protein n=1 Tax=Martelella sp. AD-3 TaxID=686597 RepID=UPI000463566C|nr:tripartite tricarboxylate transporter substrate binding protein [Martelella sp. AD-3]AMM86961.1 ABC transporter substrate-binding protein [Martelella sp. AD-3]